MGPQPVAPFAYPGGQPTGIKTEVGFEILTRKRGHRYRRGCRLIFLKLVDPAFEPLAFLEEKSPQGEHQNASTFLGKSVTNSEAVNLHSRRL